MTLPVWQVLVRHADGPVWVIAFSRSEAAPNAERDALNIYEHERLCMRSSTVAEVKLRRNGRLLARSEKAFVARAED